MKISSVSVLAFASLFTSVGPAFSQAVEEPQPVEYVRICDAYGTGYYYSPGTETCINSSTGETRRETEFGTEVGQTELAARLGEAFMDIALVSAFGDPDLVAGERFGVRVNWGSAGGENALGLAGAMVFTDNAFGAGARITGTAAIAFTNNRIGGRAGMQLTW